MDDAPTVTFLDLGYYSQFAMALRRRGVRVERVTVPTHGRLARLRQRAQLLVFDRIHEDLVADPEGRHVDLRSLTGLDGASAVEADDLPGEAMVRSVGGWVGTPRSPRVDLLFDKLAMTDFAAEQGLPVPRTWTSVPSADGEVFVVKRRVGSGGKAVRIVTGRAALAAAHDDLGAPSEVFVQEFIEGDLVCAAGVAQDGEVLQVAAYGSHPPADDPTGPAAEITVLDEPRVLAVAGKHLEALGYTGAFCIDYVRPPGGEPHFIDFNARIWSSWMGLEMAGLRIVDAYLEACGLPGGDGRGRLGHAEPGTRRPARDPLRPLDGTVGLRRPLAVVRQLRLAVSIAGWRWLVLGVGDRLVARATAAARRVSPPVVRRPSRS